MLCSKIKSSKKTNVYKTHGDVQVRLWLENDCLKMNVYISELLCGIIFL